MNTKHLFGILFAALAAAGAAEPARADRCPKLQVIGLTSDQRLVAFRACKPGKVREIGDVSGLGGGDSALVGIDFRVQDGMLYGVGNGGGVYTLDTTTGAASFVSQIGPALDGASFGVDFNPVANRLRIVSDAGQNLRHDVTLATGGTTEDLDLTYTAPPTAPVTATGIAGAAYTNNDFTVMGAANTATTLFDLDTNLNQLVIQSPPNNGILVATGLLGVDPGSAVGFDIYSVLGLDGMTTSNFGLASLSVGGVTGMYGIDMLTGKAISLGALGDSTVVDIAVPLNQ
jgi:Domain of unknown function (DUF4394)